ncbi:MAG: glycoside hydrolase family 57 protein, partial [Candidatus Kapaibacteriota bacterium]
MKPLRICFLWHQHQPYYRKEGKFILPWVRFHAIKDYLDLPSILFEFPEIKQTFNIVPSLLLQIYEYTHLGVTDRVQELSYKLPTSLSEDEKQEILKQFFVCNYQNLIAKYPRYLELHNKANSNVEFSEQDWLDLQVWYNLAWLGQLTRQRPQFKRYFTKEKGFSQKEKELLLDEQLRLMNEIVPVLKQLNDLNQVELSVSPFYHPILPLLCDASIAKVALPELNLSEPIFKFPQDAEIQIYKGKQYFNEVFGFEPKGIWPSEGSLSTIVLDLMLKLDFTWTATDPKLLFRTTGIQEELVQYFPHLYEKDDKWIALFFRDTLLSDSIGFTYHQWKPEDAVFDFVSILKGIRNRIIDRFGEESLDIACVPIILDGENCWEYYEG